MPAFLFLDLKQNKMVGDIVGPATLTDFDTKVQSRVESPNAGSSGGDA